MLNEVILTIGEYVCNLLCNLFGTTYFHYWRVGDVIVMDSDIGRWIAESLVVLVTFVTLICGMCLIIAIGNKLIERLSAHKKEN